MENTEIKNFLDACDDFLSCKYLVAEYKIQRLLQVLANSADICQLIGDCLEQYNRDREFAKTFIKDSHGEFYCEMPEEEYKIIALAFCTLVDIDNKKIDLNDFVKRFFGREENPFQAFLQTIVLPFRNLIAEAFGAGKIATEEEEEPATETFYQEEEDEDSDEEEGDEDEEDEDEFLKVQKLAVQILSELEYARRDKDVIDAQAICRAIVKTTELRDSDITYSLALALRGCKVKAIKFLVREILYVLDI